MTLIAVAGTPGTGKTQLAKFMSKRLDARLLSVSRLAKEMRFPVDRKRKARIVDAGKLQKLVKKKLAAGINIIEGHPSHLLDADIVIVLRCDPLALEKRLKRRHWPEAKIKENVEAEALDVVLIEALERHKKQKVLEADSTRFSVRLSRELCMAVEKLLKSSCEKTAFMPGTVNWAAKYGDEL